jgi:hypothetical protein
MINLDFDIFCKIIFTRCMIIYEHSWLSSQNEHVHGHIDGVVCDNVPIFGTRCILGGKTMYLKRV